MRSAPSQEASLLPANRLHLTDFLFVPGVGLLLLAVFLEWRHTQATGLQGPVSLSVTAWETGMLGGEGLFLTAAFFLLGFPLLLSCFRRLSPVWLSIPFLLLNLFMLISTVQRVLFLYAVPGHPTHMHTYLSVGFYLAMLGGNLLLLAFLRYCQLARKNKLLSWKEKKASSG